MKRQRWFTGLAVAGQLFLGLASAGVYYEAKTTGEGRAAKQQEAFVKAWASGEAAKVVFESSANPMAKPGTYLLSTDGGQTMVLVNPEDKTYAKWDLDAMVHMAAGVTKMMNMDITDFNVKKLEEKPGGLVAGVPTTYYKFRTTYRQTMKFMMMQRDDRVEEVHELWVAPELVEKALGVYLRKTPPKTVSEGLNRLMAAEFEKIKGIPLKMRRVVTTQDKKGNTETNVTTMEVLKLQAMPVPESTFAIPAGYKEVSLLPSGEGEEGEENPMAKIFGGKKKQ
ncbi:MAG: DUF4412 domain-containing protein [Thermoanaerobaculum sp.]